MHTSVVSLVTTTVKIQPEAMNAVMLYNNIRGFTFQGRHNNVLLRHLITTVANSNFVLAHEETGPISK